MNREPDECLVICNGCNGYLFSASIYDTNKEVVFRSCPFKCRTEFDGKKWVTKMDVPDGWGQRYGRS